MKTDIVLLHPPAVKPSEPPLGAAVLLDSLRRKGISAQVLDANLGAYLHLLSPGRVRAASGVQPSTSLRRALQHLPASLEFIRSSRAAASAPRYATAVTHLEAALSAFGQEGERLSLGDYVHRGFSEFAPADLATMADGEGGTLFAGYFRDVLLPQVIGFSPRIVALSVNYRHQVLPAFELAGMLRRSLPETTVVAGGGMITSWKRELRRSGLRFSCFDRLILGPGERPLAELAAGREGGGYLLEGGDEVHFHPDFSFAPMAEYFSPVPVLPVSLSRGCYWRRCLFCPEAAAPTHPYDSLPPGEVSSLLRELSRRYGARHFHLTDNAVPIPALRALAEERGELSGISWHGFVRFEQALCEAAFVRSLGESGCRMLQLGLESGSPHVLQRLGKGTSLETAGTILENLHTAGIASYVYVLLGTPGESQNDAEMTKEFLERHAERIGFLNLAVMNLPRHSPMLEDPAAFGIASAGALPQDESLGLYRTFTPSDGWGRAEARRFLQKRLLASPVLRGIVRRTPPAFTSNHAFLFS